MAKLNYKVIMNELKLRLKRLKISYARLAQNLDVPESTLKKWFLAEDGSFNRIVLICQAIGVPLEIVLKSIEEQTVRTFTMSKEQQNLFSKNRTAFKVFWLLVYERKTPEDLSTALKISPAEYKSTLLKLDKVGLIELGQDDKTKIPKLRPIQWEFKGPFMEELHGEWVRDILGMSRSGKEGHRENLQFFQLSQNSFEEFFRDLRNLEEKYARRTIIELGSSGRKLRQLRYLNAVAEESYLEEVR